MPSGYGDKPAGYFGSANPLVISRLALRPGARILDVGCGDGELGRLIKSQQPDAFVAGVESHAPAAARAESALDEVWSTDFEAWDPPACYRGSFDCAVLADVLEHMIEPEEALRKVVTLLRADGCIVASIPNVRWLPVVRDLALRGRWTYQSEGVLDHTHLRFFTRSSMRAMFERCGLEIVECAPAFNTGRGIRRLPLRLLGMVFSTFEELGAIQYVITARLPVSAGTDESGNEAGHERTANQ